MDSTLYALNNAQNTTTILNPSPLPSAREIDSFPWHKVDWLIVNESEAQGLYDVLSDRESSKATSRSNRELIAILSAQPAFATTNIICTLGKDGVLAFIPAFHRPKTAHESPSFLHFPAARLQGDVRDTTGAGDCFTGYFVQGLMEYGPHAKVGKEIREQDIARILKLCVQVNPATCSHLLKLIFESRQRVCVSRERGQLTVYPRGWMWKLECPWRRENSGLDTSECVIHTFFEKICKLVMVMIYIYTKKTEL